MRTYAFTPATLERGPKRKRYEVRVVENGEVLSNWSPATRIDGDRFLIEVHPVFRGAVMNRGELEVRKV